jgi:coproporphyrinogen III oxidase-like Fe-S oxidoreductase
MYHGVKFHTASMKQIEHDIQEARYLYGSAKRIFLTGADPFVLSANKLKAIAGMINDNFPEVETIAMYASVKNIIGKTDEELKELRQMKINELNIGIESGIDEVLHHLNKGFTLEEARTQLKRLNNAGISFSLNIILGAAGSNKWMDNAIANAKILNELQPYLIFVATLHVDDGSALYDELKSGKFTENTLGQNLREELEMLKRLELNNTIFFGLHTSNVIPVNGNLPNDKKALIDYLERGLSKIPERILNSKPEKGFEGRAIIE